MNEVRSTPYGTAARVPVRFFFMLLLLLIKLNKNQIVLKLTHGGPGKWPTH